MTVFASTLRTRRRPHRSPSVAAVVRAPGPVRVFRTTPASHRPAARVG